MDRPLGLVVEKSRRKRWVLGSDGSKKEAVGRGETGKWKADFDRKRREKVSQLLLE